jgi:hypothetical protein
MLSGGRIPTGEWTHVALVLDGDETVAPDSLKLYVNGRLADSGAASMLWKQNDKNAFGQVASSSVYRGRYVRFLMPFVGQIDDAVIWNEALAGDDIETLVLSSVE